MTDHTDETSKHGGQETDVEQKPTSSMRRVLARRDFRLLAAGTGTSLLGDQFSMIAMPWLVLQLTHDPDRKSVV